MEGKEEEEARTLTEGWSSEGSSERGGGEGGFGM